MEEACGRLCVLGSIQLLLIFFTSHPQELLYRAVAPIIDTQPVPRFFRTSRVRGVSRNLPGDSIGQALLPYRCQQFSRSRSEPICICRTVHRNGLARGSGRSIDHVEQPRQRALRGGSPDQL